RLEYLVFDELNVKKLSFSTDRGEVIDYIIKPIPEILGKKYGRLFPKIQETMASMNPFEAIKAIRHKGHLTIIVDEQEIRLFPEEIKIVEQPKSGWALFEEGGILVAINTAISSDLRLEGLARDIVRRIQNQRKEAGFNIADQIEMYYEAGPILKEVFESFWEYIAAETLSVVIREGKPNIEAHQATYQLSGETLTIWLRKAGS
ncbi:MAG: DUF5915 domain-containing protein, partial [Candidatus Bathyarchaeia archaeon]